MPDSRNAADLLALRLKRNEDRRLQAGHLWIFSNEIDTAQTPLQRFAPGELVRVLAHNDRSLGIGYVNPHSLIAGRLLQTSSIPDAQWLRERIRTALALRERLYPEAYYRLVYGESDGLPGLVVDRYGTMCVAQLGTAGMERLKGEIALALRHSVGCSTLIFKNDGAARAFEGLPSYVEAAFGELEAEVMVREGGLEFRAPLGEGQKTGWFFDQAANRAALGNYVRRGARVLDVFSYVGAWAVRAATAGAAEVLCVDSSATALDFARRNAEHNGQKVGTLHQDAFDALAQLQAGGARYDVVVIDPPAFAKRKKDLPKALGAYKRLNQLAMGVLADEGILVSCSCSFHLAAEQLQDAIGKAARAGQRHVQIIASGAQAADHPVHPAIAETRYLKTYFCRVSDGLK